MTNAKRLILLMLFLVLASTARSQVLISLIFGEKLNSNKVEFGLIGGLNWSNLQEIESATTLRTFNLGFYFHLLMKNNSYFGTGVLVKSDMGATGMDTYPVGDADLDSVFVDGTLTKRIGYFHIPLLYHYRIKNRVYFEGGVQIGLRINGYDIFTKSAYGGDLEYIRNTRDEYTTFDGGLLGSFGVKFKDKPKSMSMGLRYYYGLADINKIPETSLRNSSLYLFVKIPIGVGDEPPVE